MEENHDELADTNRANSAERDGTMESAPRRDVDFTRELSFILIGCGCLSLFTLPLADRQEEKFIVSVLVSGTVIGQVVALGAALATRRQPWSVRLPYACLWIGAITVSLFVSMLAIPQLRQADGFAAFIVAISAMGIGIASWATMESTIRGALWIAGRRIERISSATSPIAPRRQCSLRQLFLATTVISVVLALGRLAHSRLDRNPGLGQVVFPLLVVALFGIAWYLHQTLNWLAVLAPRRWQSAIALAAALNLVITPAETLAFMLLSGNGPPDFLVLGYFAGHVLVVTGWVLTFAATYRLAGYRLTNGTSNSISPPPFRL